MLDGLTIFHRWFSSRKMSLGWFLRMAFWAMHATIAWTLLTLFDIDLTELHLHIILIILLHHNKDGKYRITV